MINIFVFTVIHEQSNWIFFFKISIRSMCWARVRFFLKSAYSLWCDWGFFPNSRVNKAVLVVVILLVAKSTQMQESKKHNEFASSVTSLNCISAIRRPEPKPFVRTASCSRHPPCLDDSQTLSSAHSWPDDPFDGLLEALSIIPERERNGPPTCFGFENHVDDQLNQP